MILNPNYSIPVHSCPASMHQVLWGQRHPVTIRLFFKASTMHLHPQFEMHRPLLHYPIFSSSGFDLNPENQIKYLDVRLEPNQMIFLPQNFLISLKTAVSYDDVSSTEFNILRSCFLDASNLNMFRNDLTNLDSKVSSYAKDILNIFNDPTFDFKMNREVKESVYDHGVITQLEDIQSTSHEASDSETETPKNNRNQRNRKLGGKFRGIEYF